VRGIGLRKDFAWKCHHSPADQQGSYRRHRGGDSLQKKSADRVCRREKIAKQKYSVFMQLTMARGTERVGREQKVRGNNREKGDVYRVCERSEN